MEAIDTIMVKLASIAARSALGRVKPVGHKSMAHTEWKIITFSASAIVSPET